MFKDFFNDKNTKRIQDLESQVKKLKRENEKLEIERDGALEDRNDAKDVWKAALKNEADRIANDIREGLLDKREKYLDKLAESMKWDKAPASVTTKPETYVQSAYRSY